MTIGQTIESIDVHGNRRLMDEEILKYVQSEAGKFYEEDQAKRDLGSILQTGQFVPQSTRFITTAGKNGGIVLIFEVRELPLIGEFKIDGLRYITEQDIRDELRQHDAEIELHSPYDLQKLRKAREVVRAYLNNRGFEEAVVNLNEEEVDFKTVIITIVIKESPLDEDPF